MNKIKLMKLEISNFKGVKAFEMDTKGKNISIHAENGTGKTTTVDAFTWCLFNKNSEGNTKFNIKPLKADGTEIHGVDSNVTVVLEKDGILTTFSKTYSEVWRTPTGKSEKVFDSHKTIYSVNEGNVPQKVFQERVNDLIDEKVFKMLTDVYAFTSMKDKEQREILFKVLGGDIPVEDIINSNIELKPLTTLLETTKLEFLESETKGQIKKNKDEKDKIPSRLDELNNMLVEVNIEEKLKDVELIKDELKIINKEIDAAAIHNEEIIDKQNELLAKEMQYENEYIKAKSSMETKYIDDVYKKIGLKDAEYAKEYNKLKTEIDGKYDMTKQLKEIDLYNDQLIALNSVLWGSKDTKQKIGYQLSGIITNLDNARSSYKVANKSKFVFNEKSTICPTCKRPMENVEKFKKDSGKEFDTKKIETLARLKTEGSSYAADKKVFEASLKKVDEDIKNTHNTILEVEAEITKIKANMIEKPPVESESLITLDEEIATLKTEIRNIPELEITFEGIVELKLGIGGLKGYLKNNVTLDAITQKITKRLLESRLATLDKEIQSINGNDKINFRINELLDRERDLANKIATLEGINNLLKIFTITKANLISTKINQKFKNISFKLFETFIGSDGVKEVCEATINGVPYSNANSAAKINAGLEIISILSEYYEASCPIFIDGCESITHPQKTDSQLITLNVTDFTDEDGTISNEKVEAFKILHPTATKINNMYMEVMN